MDLVIGAKRVIVAMEHTVKGAPKIMKRCTLPLTAVGCVNLIITNMCVLEVTPEGLLMTEINPEYTVAEVQAATEAELIVRAKHKRPEGEGLQSFRQLFSFLLLSVHKRLCCGVEQRARKGAQTRGTALFTYRQECY